jgi:hypothetical protein
MVSAVATEESVVARQPEISGLGDGLGFAISEGGHDVEMLDAVAFVLSVEALRRRLISSALKPETDSSTAFAWRSASVLARSGSSQSPLILFRARIEVGLLRAEVHEDDRHGLVAEAPGSHEPLGATHHDVVVAPCNDRLNEAPLAEAVGEGVQLHGVYLRGFAGSGCRSSIEV